MVRLKGLFDLRSLFQGRDPDTLRTFVLVALALILSSALVWLISNFVGFGAESALGQTLRSAVASPWAFPVLVLTFLGGSFLGAPQFLLIALAVGAFGPLHGFIFAYIATLISASVNFAVARWFGAAWLERRRSAALKSLVAAIGRNGFISSMAVRIVPSAPFIIVNAALGLTRVPFSTFLAGTAIGIIPKTAIVALLGKVVERAIAGDVDAILYVVLGLGVWVLLALLARRLVRDFGPMVAPNGKKSNLVKSADH